MHRALATAGWRQRDDASCGLFGANADWLLTRTGLHGGALSIKESRVLIWDTTVLSMTLQLGTALLSRSFVRDSFARPARRRSWWGSSTLAVLERQSLSLEASSVHGGMHDCASSQRR